MAKLLPSQVVIAAFHDEEAADAAADALAKAVVKGEIMYRNMATVSKSKDAKLKVKEMGDMNAFAAASVGGLIGGLSCFLLGPAGIAAGAAAGAVIGGAGSKAMIEGSIDKNRVTEVGNVLPVGSSAIMVVFEELPIDKTTWKTTEVQQIRDELIYELAKNIGETLRKGENVAFLYAVGEEGLIATRMASGIDVTDIQGLVVTAEGMIAGKAAVVDENVLVYEVAATDGEVVGIEAGVVSEEGAAAVKAAIEKGEE